MNTRLGGRKWKEKSPSEESSLSPTVVLLFVFVVFMLCPLSHFYFSLNHSRLPRTAPPPLDGTAPFTRQGGRLLQRSQFRQSDAGLAGSWLNIRSLK